MIADQMQERSITQHITRTENGMTIALWHTLLDKAQMFGDFGDCIAIRIRTTWCNNHHDFVETMDLMADGRILVDPLHDKTVGLSQLPEEIALLADDPSSAIKVLVDPAR